jgi:small subunit ribosomal protein S8
MTDPIADMLARIRNANKAMHASTEMPASKLKVEIARILKEEGYIKDFHVMTSADWNGAHEDKREQRSFDTLTVDLKFGRNRQRVLNDLKRVSKPGRRIYWRKDRTQRVPMLGVAILSTSQGVLTSRKAQERGIGGEVICYVW